MLNEHTLSSRPYSGFGDSEINETGKILALVKPKYCSANLIIIQLRLQKRLMGFQC